MQIKKVKLEDKGAEGATIIFIERPEGRKERKTTYEDQTPVHADLVQAFQNLAIHLAILTGYVSVKQVKNVETPKPELVDGYWINSLSVKSGDDPGVVISGHKVLETGKAVILNTPFQRFEEGEESAYKFTDDLVDKIERAEKEVNAYVDGTKKGDDPQLGLFPAQEPKLDGQTEDLEFEEIAEGDAEVWKDGQRPK